ncbi:MAG: hypothetical protein ACAH80_13855 [Alphaproteobacteria bacterium]
MGKKYRERVERERNADWNTKMRRGIVFKIFVFSFKALYVLAFLCYLALGSAMTYSWATTKWNRHYPPEHAGRLCQKYATGKDPAPDKIVDWIMARNATEADVIIAALEPCTPYLSSTTFLAYSNWKYQLGKLEEALNWRQYARFRARFDALRCGSNDAGDNLNSIIDISARDELQQLMERNPSLLPKSITWTLEYDAKFPPPQNNPYDLCKQLTSLETGKFRMVPRSDWGGIHNTLRQLSAYFVGLMEDDIKRGGRGIIEMPKLKINEGDINSAMSAPEKDEEEKKPEKEE